MSACDSPLHSLLSTLKNKELSPVIGQKGIQGTPPSSGQSLHSDHSPHTLRRCNINTLLPVYLHFVLSAFPVNDLLVHLVVN